MPIESGKLEFDLDEPDGREAFRRASQALDLALALLAIQDYFRQRLKFCKDEEVSKILREVQTSVEEILIKYGIDLDFLVS